MYDAEGNPRRSYPGIDIVMLPADLENSPPLYLVGDYSPEVFITLGHPYKVTVRYQSRIISSSSSAEIKCTLLSTWFQPNNYSHIAPEETTGLPVLTLGKPNSEA